MSKLTEAAALHHHLEATAELCGGEMPSLEELRALRIEAQAIAEAKRQIAELDGE